MSLFWKMRFWMSNWSTRREPFQLVTRTNSNQITLTLGPFPIWLCVPNDYAVVQILIPLLFASDPSKHDPIRPAPKLPKPIFLKAQAPLLFIPLTFTSINNIPWVESLEFALHFLSLFFLVPPLTSAVPKSHLFSVEQELRRAIH